MESRSICTVWCSTSSFAITSAAEPIHHCCPSLRLSFQLLSCVLPFPALLSLSVCDPPALAVDRTHSRTSSFHQCAPCPSLLAFSLNFVVKAFLQFSRSFFSLCLLPPSLLCNPFNNFLAFYLSRLFITVVDVDYRSCHSRMN